MNEDFADMVMETGLWKEPEKLYGALVNYNHLQKHEKIEKMAWEVTLQTIVPTSPKEYTCVPCKVAWGMAEKFYDYAKQKQAKTDV